MKHRALLALLLALGCNKTPPPRAPEPPPTLESPFTEHVSEHYSDEKNWLCLPGRDDACTGDLTPTELHADGSKEVVKDSPESNAHRIDCFYVYPTVDWSMNAANHEDFADLSKIQNATLVQAGRFRDVCRLFVPLYRQVTLGTYFKSDEVAERYLSVAESDIVDAFLQYMAKRNGGRKVVLLGHSQGAQMTARLLQRYFDTDKKMRERLLLAMPIGWPLEVARGKLVGGTFKNVPVCSRSGETGCIVSYRSFPWGGDPSPGRARPSAGHESVCVDPVALLRGAPGVFSRSFLPTLKGTFSGIDDVETPFVMLRDFYSGRCVDGENGFRYMGVAATPREGDTRKSPVDLGALLFKSQVGLHLLDFQFAQGDLIELVRERSAKLGP